MTQFKIAIRPYDAYTSRLVVVDRSTNEEIAEFRTAPEDNPETAARKLRADIREHINNGGTLRNYQW